MASFSITIRQDCRTSNIGRSYCEIAMKSDTNVRSAIEDQNDPSGSDFWCKSGKPIDRLWVLVWRQDELKTTTLSNSTPQHRGSGLGALRWNRPLGAGAQCYFFKSLEIAILTQILAINSKAKVITV